jgi:hypothetical protein
VCVRPSQIYWGFNAPLSKSLSQFSDSTFQFLRHKSESACILSEWIYYSIGPESLSPPCYTPHLLPPLPQFNFITTFITILFRFPSTPPPTSPPPSPLQIACPGPLSILFTIFDFGSSFVHAYSLYINHIMDLDKTSSYVL